VKPTFSLRTREIKGLWRGTLKKRAFLLAVFVTVMVFFVPTIASADDLSAFVGQTEYLTVLPYAPDYENNGSFYVGLTGYILSHTADYLNTGLVSGLMFCNDSTDEINVPTTYPVVVESLSSSSQIINRMGLTNADLWAQAYLGLGFGTSQSGNSATDSLTQEAIWVISGGSIGGSYASIPTVAALVTNAETNHNSVLKGYLFNAVDYGQDFMPVVPPPPPPVVPEPSSLLLLGTGLLGLAVGLFRKMRMRPSRNLLLS
jgi:hypothetical protein